MYTRTKRTYAKQPCVKSLNFACHNLSPKSHKRQIDLFQAKLTQDGAGLWLVVKDTKYALPYSTRVLACINTRPNTCLLVVCDYWTRLIVVCTQSLLEDLCIIVGSLDQRFARNIVLHRLLGRVEYFMVGSAGCGMNESTSDSLNEQLIINLQFDGVLQRLFRLLQHVVETFCLSDCSWEAIENEPILLSCFSWT